MITLTVDPALRALLPDLRLGGIAASDAVVLPTDPDLWAEIEQFEQRLRAEFAGRAAADRAEIAATRRAYRTLGDDPTHYRPANEALLRRVLSNKPLPRINVAVDANTLVSLESGWPLGCYNLDAIQGNITVRRGGPDDAYLPIGKPEVRAANRLVLCDDAGIFGSPTADSVRTQVTPGVERLLFVVYAFDGMNPEAAIRRSAELLQRYCRSQPTICEPQP